MRKETDLYPTGREIEGEVAANLLLLPADLRILAKQRAGNFNVADVNHLMGSIAKNWASASPSGVRKIQAW